MVDSQGEGPVSIVSGTIHWDGVLICIIGRNDSEQQYGFPSLCLLTMDSM